MSVCGRAAAARNERTGPAGAQASPTHATAGGHPMHPYFASATDAQHARSAPTHHGVRHSSTRRGPIPS